uniref:Uncharacterized protein n=1 Tax=Bursaphelenchus xylophilus TaxID=6326 RepID=A0A1I7RN21_BURXY
MAKKAKEAASAAIKKAEEERALKEEAEKEVSELQARHREHLRTAVADGRPPRAERSSDPTLAATYRSTKSRGSWAFTKDAKLQKALLPPALSRPSTSSAPPKVEGTSRTWPSASRRGQWPRRTPTSTKGTKTSFTAHRGHVEPIVSDFTGVQVASSKGSKSLLSAICPIKTYDKQPRDPVSSKCTQTLVRPAGTRKICPIREQPEHPAPHFIRGPSGILAGARVPSSPCFGQFAAEIRSRSSKTELRGGEHPSPLNEPGGLLDRKRVLFPVCGRSRSTPAPHLIRGAFWKINGCSAGPQNMKTGPREERRPGPLNEPGGPLQELKGAIFPLFGQFGTEIR